jgi:hypothetical protein
MSLTGYTGQDLQRIAFVRWQDAIRVRVGPRGNYKAGMAQMADGRLIAAVCRDNARPEPTQRYFDIFLYESTDLGLSWRAMEHTPLLGKEPSLTALPDGALLFTRKTAISGRELPTTRSIWRARRMAATLGKSIIIQATITHAM